MSTALASVTKLVHDTSSALIDQQIASKVASMATGFLNSGFEIVDDALKIVRDLSAPAAPSTPPPAAAPAAPSPDQP
ncbi:hypothetical protein OKW43_008080 [Paraburkholderia sp. WC7.3g]|uniref:hypothetical protein n=1 Tax=Paraburkholderia sp. WC7.3g TaxID=2991070 RepID=UPI003D1EC6C9